MQRSRFSELPGSVDGKVFALINQNSYLCQALIQIDHVMLLGITDTSRIKETDSFRGIIKECLSKSRKNTLAVY